MNAFICSRRSGTSARTLEFYRGYLRLATPVVGSGVTGHDIKHFLDALSCTDGGRHAYFRALRAFYNWLYSPRSGLGLNAWENPMLLIDSPRVGKKILPSLTSDQLDYLIAQAECLRDRAIISLFADSGLRLSELARIAPDNIDWTRRLVKVWVKGNKEGLAPFGARTAALLEEWLSTYLANGTIWDLAPRGIAKMLLRLKEKTGLNFTAHTFRRTFASILAKRGIDSLHIMRLGRWESIQMVELYTKSMKFEDSLKLYTPVIN
ncbi:MAG: tyrosine-type recombinase/integrase [Chloroflexi bacterium]|nr:tyrosine-type recombinase/integrase [Chloroflexota bacterium]